MIMGSESSGLSELAAEFPGYDFGTQPTWDGVSIFAIRPAKGTPHALPPDDDD